jgi:O-antigen ligase
MSFAVLASIGLADGGLFPRTWRLGTLALLALAGAALLARRRVALGRLEWATLAALAAFAAWIAVSGAWSGRFSVSVLESERALLYVVAVLAVLLVAERRSLRPLLAGALAAISGVCAYGLGVHVFTSPPLDPIEGALLFQPLGYANALGIFATIGILLATGLALATRRPLARALLLAPLAILLPALYLTSSRGAWLALVAGLACIARLGGRLPRRVAVLLAVLATAAVVAVLTASGGSLSRVVGYNRPHYWQVALKEYEQNPALGSGAGTYADYWLRDRPDPSFTRTAHSLYLQSLAELGPLGLALVVTALGLPLLALRGRSGDPVVATAAAAYAAYGLHAAIDWDWELPAVTLAGLVCGAALLVAARPVSSRPLSRRARGLLLALGVAAAAFTCVRLATGSGFPFGP